MRILNGLAVVLGPDGGVACVLLVAVAAVALCLLCADAATRTRTTPEGASAAAFGAASGTSASDVPAAADEFAFRALSTLELCEALRCSYLPGPDDSPEQTEWARVRMRGHLLDEIERRDPAGFNRWLATQPHAGSDPRCFLSVHALDESG
jgi:hypothetical protein